jgi:hypothetical protein
MASAKPLSIKRFSERLGGSLALPKCTAGIFPQVPFRRLGLIRRDALWQLVNSYERE